MAKPKQMIWCKQQGIQVPARCTQVCACKDSVDKPKQTVRAEISDQMAAALGVNFPQEVAMGKPGGDLLTEEEVDALLQPGPIEIRHDQIGDLLDEIADLAEVWKKSREYGRIFRGLRGAMLQLAGEIEMMNSLDKAIEVGEKQK